MKKTRIFLIGFMAIICICALAFGVYSIKRTMMSAGGEVQFNARQIECSISANITGAFNQAGERYTNLQHTTLDDWSINGGNLIYFDDKNNDEIENVEDIVIQFSISNTSNRPAYAYFTNSSGEYIDYVSVDGITESDVAIATLSGRSYIAADEGSEGTDDAITMEIRFSLKKWERLNLNFNYTLNIDDYGTVMSADGLASGTSAKKEPSATLPNVVYLPDTMTSIDSEGFKDCTNLTGIVIPSSVTSISPNAFERCRGLTSITLPESIGGNIGGSAFSGCTSLTIIKIQGWATTTINDDTFSGCTGLTRIEMPFFTNSIGSRAFYGCSSLTNISIPNSVTSIGSYAFWNCSGLTSIAIPSGVTSISSYSFGGCTGLKSLYIPSNVRSIGVEAFSACAGLTSVTIPDGVTSIASLAFGLCSGLTSITISGSVTSIADAFRDCQRLAIITVNSDNTTYRSEGNCLIQKSNNALILGCKTSIIPSTVTTIDSHAFDGCSALKNIAIPNSVTTIGSHAFADCSALKNIAIPNSVTSIDSYAFWRCSGLTSIIIPESVTGINMDAFMGCNNLSRVVLNVGSGMAWRCQYLGDWISLTATDMMVVLDASSTPTVGDITTEPYSFFQYFPQAI